jgi:hypothetical protein
MISGVEVSGTYDIDHLGFEALRDWDLKIPGVVGLGEADNPPWESPHQHFPFRLWA